MKSTSRPPAVAGLFYPESPPVLRMDVERYIHDAAPTARKPKALIAPHAGYVYSGPVAGSAYAALEGMDAYVRRVVLLGPSHRVSFKGFALPDSRSFETPLGLLPVDVDAVQELESLPMVGKLEKAHADEHSLEVHLPFLQVMLGDFSIIPIVVGQAEPHEVQEVLDRVWGGKETLIVISSDLSHYHDYQTARELDRTTSESIVQNAPEQLTPTQACGCIPIQGLLLAAEEHRLRGEAVDVRNSGDTAGPRDRVVGYGAYVFADEH